MAETDTIQAKQNQVSNIDIQTSKTPAEIEYEQLTPHIKRLARAIHKDSDEIEDIINSLEITFPENIERFKNVKVNGILLPHFAAQKSPRSLLYMAKSPYFDVNTLDANRLTPLNLVFEYCDLDLALYLSNRGLQANYKNQVRALTDFEVFEQIIIKAEQQGQNDIIEEILKRDEIITYCSRNGRNIFMEAFHSSPKVYEILLNHNFVKFDGKTLYVLQKVFPKVDRGGIPAIPYKKIEMAKLTDLTKSNCKGVLAVVIEADTYLDKIRELMENRHYVPLTTDDIETCKKTRTEIQQKINSLEPEKIELFKEILIPLIPHTTSEILKTKCQSLIDTASLISKKPLPDIEIFFKQNVNSITHGNSSPSLTGLTKEEDFTSALNMRQSPHSTGLIKFGHPYTMLKKPTIPLQIPDPKQWKKYINEQQNQNHTHEIKTLQHFCAAPF